MTLSTIQYRLIVAAKSRAEASRITGVSAAHIKKFWSITENEEQVMSKPGTIFIHEMNFNNSPWAELGLRGRIDDHRDYIGF